MMQPRLFPWHASAWERISARIRQACLAHGILISGARGLGKAHLAYYLAQTVLCEQSGVAPCGVCPSCHWVQAGTHPDFRVVAPEEEGKAIGVDAIRDLITFFGLKAQRAKKVAIIDPADRLTESAANSLLKTLEEPPGDALIILLTANHATLLPTVKSRCQHYSMGSISPADASAWLMSEEKSEAVPLLPACDYAPLEALRLVEQGKHVTRSAWLGDVWAVAEGQADPIATAERWSKEDLSLLLVWLGSCLVDAITLAADPARCALNQDFAVALGSLARRLGGKELFLRLDELIEMRRRVNHPLNKQLIMESLLLRWAQ
jgi:DNA polymerase III subunit delta'